ncbi:MAG: sulfatase/phosphatase domain-containing protein, partial [Planctomycetaceae bacterium]
AMVPLLVSVPGRKPAVCHSFVELLDLFPTTLSLCGMPVPGRLQGRDISELLENPQAEVRTTAFSVAPMRKGFLLRNDRWAWIQYGEDGGNGVELFDMKKDPGQFTNLAGKAEFRTVVEDFRNQLRQKLAEIRDNDLQVAATGSDR